jgi:hypothetical protein
VPRCSKWFISLCFLICTFSVFVLHVPPLSCFCFCYPSAMMWKVKDYESHYYAAALALPLFPFIYMSLFWVVTNAVWYVLRAVLQSNTNEVYCLELSSKLLNICLVRISCWWTVRLWDGLWFVQRVLKKNCQDPPTSTIFVKKAWNADECFVMCSFFS